MLASVRASRRLTRAFQFLTGGVVYALLEILWRGYTHISMFLLGGFCFTALIRFDRLNLSFAAKCCSGSALITASEFCTGCVVNLWWGLNVWDYGEEPLNLAGQICPRYFLLWCILCALFFGICALYRFLRPRVTALRRRFSDRPQAESFGR